MTNTYGDPAADLLAALTARLPALTGDAVPERRYVHVGEVAIDFGCDQLVVAFERATPGLPGVEFTDVRQPRPPVRTAQYAVLYTRCVPTFTGGRGTTPPTPAALSAAGMQMMGDADAVWQATRAAHKAGEWASGCDLLQWVETEAVGPQGGAGGVLVRLLAQV